MIFRSSKIRLPLGTNVCLDYCIGYRAICQGYQTAYGFTGRYVAQTTQELWPLSEQPGVSAFGSEVKMFKPAIFVVGLTILSSCHVDAPSQENERETNAIKSAEEQALSLLQDSVAIPTGKPKTYIEQCEDRDVEVPPALPFPPTRCVKGQKANGWTCAGGLTAKCNLAGIAGQAAKLWVWTGKNTICFYLPRWSGSKGPKPQGLLCFNRDSCTACAFDSNDSWKKTPGDLDTPRSIENCAACHRDGVVSPTVAMQDLIDDYLTEWIDPLRSKCADQCGVNWVLDGPTSDPVNDPWPTPAGEGNCCTPPTACESCHSNFVKPAPNKKYCEIFGTAIGHLNGDRIDGSMVDHWPIDPTECRALISCMECNEELKNVCPGDNSNPSASATPPPLIK